ncbi:hypothetical protein FLONG3_10658 [Fusarium longipes]|uniref:Uncharacterized protein n=1 Tax=Fusarium longipes TaxID=694270 RepID=A0A395RMM1_9HYPO|nr:hypothetical protein FLONG3_10658 [Fusarium longipes]
MKPTPENKENGIPEDQDMPDLVPAIQERDEEMIYIADHQEYNRTNFVENWSAVTERIRDQGTVWDYEVERSTY